MARAVVIPWSSGRAGGTVAGTLARPRGQGSGFGVLLAHGAGAGQDHPFMSRFRDGLAASGHLAMTFDYAYIAEGRKAPDRPPKLLAVHQAATTKLAGYADRIVLAGKSMGGRMASHLAAGVAPDGTEFDAAPCAGLVYLGYPLIPVGKTEPRDVSHLAKVGAPMLFVAGTRDRLAPLESVQRVVASLPDADLQVVEGGDHSFRVPKGRDDAEVLGEVIQAVAGWIGTLR